MFVTALLVLGAKKKIEVPQTPLRDCNRVVLQADVAVVVEQGNAGGVVGSGVAGLLEEGHVVFAELADRTLPGSARGWSCQKLSWLFPGSR